MTLSFKDGYEAAKQDFALHAHYEPPSETLSNEYRVGYAAGWTEARETSRKASRDAREYADGGNPKPRSVVLNFEAIDGATGSIDFAGDLEVASTVIASAIRTGIFPAVKWDVVDGVGNFQTFGCRGPFKKMEIEFQ